MSVIPKQKLYKTAYHPGHGVYVRITHAHQDRDGEWIYTCSSSYNKDCILNDVLFRDTELSNLTL